MLLALAYPPARLLLPVFVGLVPLLVFIAERPTGLAGRWSATRAGVVMGLVYFGLQLYWLVVALSPESLPLAVLAYLLLVVLLAGFTGAFAWALHYTMERLHLPLALLAAVLWTTLEWTLGRLGDLAFPWLGLGHALAPFPRIAGAADLVGATGLTFWIAAVNGLLAMALLRHRAARTGASSLAATPLVATALLLATVPAAYGFWRAATLELRPAATVAVVQPNIPQAIRRDHALALDTSLVMLTRLTGDAPGAAPEDRAIDLVAWPEVALTTELAGDDHLLTTVRDLSRQLRAPILVGAYDVGAYDVEGGDGADVRPVTFNAALLVGDQGIIGPRYHKRRLVAFVERVPFVDPAWLEPFTGPLHRYGALGRGRRGTVFRIAATQAGVGGQGAEPGADPGAAFGVLICFESAFPALARNYRRDGADFLVNITNDAWFGRESWYGRTTALWQHPAHMTMRAIESRVGVARAANTGISLFVDPLGRVHDATALFVHDVRVHTVLTTDTTTLFVRWGDWLATLTALAAAALLGAAMRVLRPGMSNR